MKEVLWRMKKHVGPHTYKGVTYHPGDTFMGPAYFAESGFSDKIEPADSVAVEAVEEHQDGGVIASLVVKHKGGGKYDVINTESGKAINDELLSRAEAYALISAKEGAE